MKKFFLFRREQLTLFSSNSSDDGSGLSVLAVPADKLSFMTAGIGKVQFNFDDASVYDYVTLPSSDVIDKTHIIVSCQEGKEVDLMLSVMNFISSDSKKNILRFDAVDNEATLNEAKVDGFEDISAIVNATPINIVTQETDTSSSVIAGVDFLASANLPFIDYNHNDLSSYSTGQHISSWANDASATGGSDYDMTDQGGSNTTATTAGATSKVTTTSANIIAGNYFQLANEMVHNADYTMYCAFGFPGYTNMYEIFSSSDATGKGFTNGKFNLVSMIHDGLSGLPATSRTDNTDNGTVSYKLPDPNLEVNVRKSQTLYSFVIRRDKDFNLFFYDYKGDVFAVIPASTGGNDSTSYRTDGDLAIKNIGGVAPGYLFKGFLTRFGVIKRDVGHSTAHSIAKDLFKLYARNLNF
jgi:hypothetical protein|tara:strand:+ start:1859 stop:3091 length:1233 start_codon:yes stop_codon:yes gene_type:complete